MHLKSLALYEELGGKEGMAITYGNLGIIHQQKNDTARMCECWRKARDLWREMALMDKAAEVERLMKERGCLERP
jgi:hypothetical protein